MAPYEPPSPFERKEVNTLDERPALIKSERLVPGDIVRDYSTEYEVTQVRKSKFHGYEIELKPVDSKHPVDRLRSHFDADHLFIVVQLD